MVLEFIVFMTIFCILFSNKKVFNFLTFLLLFFFMAYREVEIGTDTKTYLIYYNYVENGEKLWVEPLWQVINQLSMYLGGFQTVLIISSLLILLPLFYVINKLPINKVLPIVFFILLYYYFMGFNIIRQSIASSFILLAFYFLSLKNVKRYIVFVVIAFLFHKTSIIALLGLLFIRIRKKETMYILQISSIVLGFFLSGVLLKMAVQFYPSYSLVMLKDNKIQVFINLVLLNGFFVYFLKQLKVHDFWFKMFFGYVILYNIFCLMPYSERLILILGITQIVFFTRSIQQVRVKSMALMTAILVILYCSAYFSLNFMNNSAEIFPYKNVLIDN